MQQKELAEKAGVSVKHLLAIEKNQSSPGHDVLMRICRALDVEPNVILEWEHEKESL
jgi:transcriptional regulator with XRE-family HTH domain